VGIGTFVLGGPADKWMFYNNLLAVLAMLVLLGVVLVLTGVCPVDIHAFPSPECPGFREAKPEGRVLVRWD
jgi:hypothetical protein